MGGLYVYIYLGVADIRHHCDARPRPCFVLRAFAAEFEWMDDSFALKLNNFKLDLNLPIGGGYIGRGASLDSLLVKEDRGAGGLAE